MLAVVGAFGLVIGSFLNVVIARLPEHRSLWRPRSACPMCGAAIAWHDNIPVLSYVALRGHCRACSAAIPWRYPVVEAATADRKSTRLNSSHSQISYAVFCLKK